MTRRAWRTVAPWLVPLLVVAEVAVVWSGLLPLDSALVAGAASETLVWVAVLGGVIVGVRHFRAGRGSRFDVWQAAEDGLSQLLPRPLARVLLLEPQTWLCLLHWVSGRRGGQAPDAFGYDRSLRPVLWMTIGLVVAEGTVADAVVALVWPGSAWIWFVAGAHLYALVWVLGLFASFSIRPHRLDDAALRLHDGIFEELVVPYAAVVDARVETAVHLGRTGVKIDDLHQSAMLAFGDTTVALTLDPHCPVETRRRRRTHFLTAVSLTVDDPGAFVTALRSRSGGRGGRGGTAGPSLAVAGAASECAPTGRQHANLPRGQAPDIGDSEQSSPTERTVLGGR